MKIFLKIILMTFIFFSTTFSKDGDGREIIKAYEKGKPAKMDIEITKVKSDNYINMIIDKGNKKIYKDITEFAPENRDLQKKLYVTDYIKKLDKSNIRETLPYRIVLNDNKKYLEIDYSNIEEPKEIYLWVVEGRKIDKLYTGVIEKEYFDPNNPLSYITLDLEEDIKKQIIDVGEDYFIFKVGEIDLKDGVDKDIKITIPNNKKHYLKDNLEEYPVELYFEESKSERILTNTNKKIELLGKYIVKDKEYFPEEVKLIGDNEKKSVNLEVEFILKTKSSTKDIKKEILEIRDHRISTMSYFDPWIDATFKLKDTNNEASVTIGGFLLGRVLKSSSNIQGKASGSITNRFRGNNLIENISMTVYNLNGDIISNSDDLVFGEKSTPEVIVNIDRVFDDLILKISVIRKSKDVKKIKITFKTKSSLDETYFPLDEVVAFNFIDEDLKFEIVENEAINFGEIYESENTTFIGTGSLTLRVPSTDEVKFYTFEFIKGDSATSETIIYLNGVSPETAKPNEKIDVTNLKCTDIIETKTEEKKLINTVLRGEIVNLQGKNKGAYSSSIRLRITRTENIGGKF